MSTIETTPGLSPDTRLYGLPPSAFLQPVFEVEQAEDEAIRAFYAGGLSREALDYILSRLNTAHSDAEVIEIIEGEHLLSPATPDPDQYHRPQCDCGRHGQIALGPTVAITTIPA